MSREAAVSAPAPTREILAAALMWWKQGEAPIPIALGTKAPPEGFALKALLNGRRPSEREIRSWWAQWPDAQVAVVLGRTLVAIDSDGRGAERIVQDLKPPRTPTQRTPRPGRHRLFRVDAPTPSRKVTAPDRSSLELRALGQYILVHPSTHPSGRRYRWEVPRTEPFAPLPPALLQLFPTSTRKADADAGRPKRSAAVQALLDRHPRLRPVFEGRVDPPRDTSGSGRDLFLAHAARKAGLSEAEAELLIRHAPYPKRRPRTVPYIRETVRKAFAARRYAPQEDAHGRLQLGHSSLATTGIYLKPTLEDRVQAVARMEAARSNGRTQGKVQKVADRLARSRRIPASRGGNLAGSGETRPGTPGQGPLAGGVAASG